MEKLKKDAWSGIFSGFPTYGGKHGAKGRTHEALSKLLIGLREPSGTGDD